MFHPRLLRSAAGRFSHIPAGPHAAAGVLSSPAQPHVFGPRAARGGGSLLPRLMPTTSAPPLPFSSAAAAASAASAAAAASAAPHAQTRPVRVRYAPSPTGSLHLGGLRTALYNYLFAKKHGGDCILRIEDTDRTRLVPGATDQLARDLAWAGIDFDEGPSQGGPHAPYTQSDRYPKYTEAANELMAKGHAYRCFCSPQRLESVRQTQMRRGAATTYDGLCAGLAPETAAARADAGEPFVVRMRVPARESGVTAVRDAVRGEVRFANKVVDDQVLLKTDGFPTYHLANVVDDHDMRITHVIRGEEWLPSAAKHVLLYEMFGWPAPTFAHLPLLLRPDGSKLSKRFKDASLDYYIRQGFLRDAVVNFVLLLGWNPASGSSSTAAADSTSDTAESAATTADAAASAATAAAAAAGDIAAVRALLDAGAVSKVGKKGKKSSSAPAAAPAAAAAAPAEASASAPESLFSSSASASAEELSLATAAPLFSLSSVQKSGATVARDKLLWFHSHYWKQALATEEGVRGLAKEVMPFVEDRLAAFEAAATAAAGSGTSGGVYAVTEAEAAALSLPFPSPAAAGGEEGKGAADLEEPLDPSVAAALSVRYLPPPLSRDPRSDPAALRLALLATRDHPCLMSQFPALSLFLWARPDLKHAKERGLKEQAWVTVRQEAEAAAAADAAAAAVAPDAAEAAAPAAGKGKGKGKKGTAAAVVATRKVLAAAADAIAAFPDAAFDGFDVPLVVARLKSLAQEQGVGLRNVYLPLRLVLSGDLAGPGVADQVCAVGKEEAVARIKAALEEYED